MHYNLQYLKGIKAKQRHPQFSSFHRIQTNLSLNKIWNHDKIDYLLRQSRIKINDHEWDKKATCISNLGFFTNTDPGNYTRSQFESDLWKKTAAKTNKLENKVPKFKCLFLSPFNFITEDDEPNYQLWTKAYSMEICQRDAKEMIELMKKTFQQNPQFMFHRT